MTVYFIFVVDKPAHLLILKQSFITKTRFLQFYRGNLIYGIINNSEKIVSVVFQTFDIVKEAQRFRTALFKLEAGQVGDDLLAATTIPHVHRPVLSAPITEECLVVVVATAVNSLFRPVTTRGKKAAFFEEDVLRLRKENERLLENGAKAREKGAKTIKGENKGEACRGVDGSGDQMNAQAHREIKIRKLRAQTEERKAEVKV